MMFDRMFYDMTSFFGGIFLLVLRVLAWIAISILRIVVPAMLFAVVLAGKGVVLFVILLLVSIWTYWRNIGILRARLRDSHGIVGFFRALHLHGFATVEDLRFQDTPFSVAAAVMDTRFYRRYISFVDMQSDMPVTIQNFMSLAWIAQVLDSGLTRIVKLAMPIAILGGNLLYLPLHLLTCLFD